MRLNRAIELNCQPMRITFALCLLLLSISATATDYFGSRGPISRSLGGTSLTLSNPWSCFNNQATLASINSFSIGAASSRIYNIEQLAIANIGMAIPFKKANATMGVSFDHLGISELYSLQRLGLTLSRFYGQSFAVGLQLEGLYLNLFDYGNKMLLNAHVGFLALPTDKLSLGLQIQNLFGQVLIESIDERLPILTRIGGNYKISEPLTFFIETSLSTNRAPKLHTGIAYAVNEKLNLRAGFSTRQLDSSFGLELKLKSVSILMAFSYHQYLGSTPELGMMYEAI